MIAALNDNTVNTVISSLQHTERTITEGSDEHLDLILDVKRDLSNMTEATRNLVAEIESNFNSFNEETAKDAVVKLFPCFRMSYQLISLIKRTILYNSVRSDISLFKRELDELKEFASDLSRYKVQKNEELIALFNDEK